VVILQRHLFSIVIAWRVKTLHPSLHVIYAAMNSGAVLFLLEMGGLEHLKMELGLGGGSSL
jgi:hypothetical protein